MARGTVVGLLSLYLMRSYTRPGKTHCTALRRVCRLGGLLSEQLARPLRQLRWQLRLPLHHPAFGTRGSRVMGVVNNLFSGRGTRHVGCFIHRWLCWEGMIIAPPSFIALRCAEFPRTRFDSVLSAATWTCATRAASSTNTLSLPSRRRSIITGISTRSSPGCIS